MDEWYADVILPLAAPPMTFGIGEGLRSRIVPGMRVVVQFGRRKYYSGIVDRVHRDKPPFKTVKSVEQAVDPAPVVTPEQLKLWHWMSEYYMCPLGMVMRAALPAGLKLDGLSCGETLKGGYRPPVRTLLRLHASLDSEEKLNAAFDSLRRAKSQYGALAEYLEKSATTDCSEPHGVDRKAVKASPAVIKALIDKCFLEQFTEEVPAERHAAPCGVDLPSLSPAQSEALAALYGCFGDKSVALLHGVTGSGKTEIYIHLMAAELEAGRNVLYMLPEIALTAQLIDRMRSYFGESVVVYHSRLNDRLRAGVYRSLLEAGGGRVIIGVRSSVLLPTPNLGLVVVDEEHEASFKQTDSAPRYHGRDTAVVLASLYGARTLLGSATPSLESYFNAVSGKYGLVTLSERYSGVSLPRVIVSDTLRAARRGEKVSHFNRELLDRIGEALERDRQVILFQNRRGFSPYVECGSCGWSASCPDCNVTLTYHKSDGSLRCHYCGYRMPIPGACPSCKAEDIRPMGFGTEKIEEELAELFPEAVVDRLDADTTRTARGYRRIVSDFEEHRTDILVGTQMITKGFDFGRVSLVGILNADNMLNVPDFRAGERAFQLMMQVGGRAGRRSEQGTVVVQTVQPQHPVIRQVCEGDYGAMAGLQLAERRSFLYPPYCRLIAVHFRYRDKALLWEAADRFAADARRIFGRRLLGPEAPPVDRIRGRYLVRFLLKIERRSSFAEAKKLLGELFGKMHGVDRFRYVDAIVDVDPL